MGQRVQLQGAKWGERERERAPARGYGGGCWGCEEESKQKLYFPAARFGGRESATSGGTQAARRPWGKKRLKTDLEFTRCWSEKKDESALSACAALFFGGNCVRKAEAESKSADVCPSSSGAALMQWFGLM